MYEIVFSPFTGKVGCVKRLSDNASIPLCEGNTDYQEFLKWNSEQATPLDLNSTIEVVPPAPARDLAKEIDILKAQVATQATKITALEKVSIE